MKTNHSIGPVPMSVATSGVEFAPSVALCAPSKPFTPDVDCSPESRRWSSRRKFEVVQQFDTEKIIIPAPLSRQLFSLRTPEATSLREIDIHYAVERTAESIHQIATLTAESLQLQYAEAEANIRGLSEIASPHDEMNEWLGVILGSLDEIRVTGIDTLSATRVQSEMLRASFICIAELIIEKKKTLESIADTLRHPCNTQVIELLNEADRALLAGMRSSGRDRTENFKDAKRLFGEVLANPIGSRNYVAWFNMGWLLWKHYHSVVEAEDAFYTAARISSEQADEYHVDSLWHMAQMQYLQGKFSDAYDTAVKVISIRSDHRYIYDAARYAAKIGHTDESISLLERCIDIQPQTIITMFSEEDFIK